MDWKLKLKALLHDPPYKIKSIATHKSEAKKLFEKIFPNDILEDDNVSLADQLASAQSRIIVKPQFQDQSKEKQFETESQVNYDECEFIDIFSERKEKIQTPDENKVLNLFDKLGKLSFPNEEERAKFIFLFLWRFYPEIFPEINKHPADSRAPNHSIYDHLVQTSAIVSALPNPAFLLFTIGPVQSFISKARKTSDLWSASYMLSYLIWESMKPLVEKFGPDVIIFPNLLGQPLFDRWLFYKKFGGKRFVDILKEDIFKDEKWFRKFIDNAHSEEKLTIANLPNRFLAVIPYKDKEKKWAEECQNSFVNKLKNFAQKVYEEIKDFSKNSVLQNDIENHLISYFQVYWVIMPWSKRGILPDDALSDYKELFSDKNELYKTIEQVVNHPYYKPANVGSAYSLILELTEKLLGARKSVRDFEVLEQLEEKCHLCGEFEVLYIDWEKLVPKFVKQGERLCGVCLTKRLFPKIIKDEFGLSDEIKFPSTSEMASIGEKRRLDNNVKKNFQEEFDKLREKLNLPSSISVPKLKGDPLYEIDGEFLMKETYREDYFKKEYGISVSSQDFQNILNLLDQINPSGYYAILQMDGDNIGKWLKGEFNPKIKDTIYRKVIDALIRFSGERDRNELQKILCSRHPTSPSIHQAFSRKLSQFALEEVRKIVEDDHYGKLVYAGGDDILAFLPIEEVLGCAYELQKKFKEILSQKASMSAGILIVHHKYPLYLALKKVNEAEKRTKNVYGKNGFCLVFLTHSGGERECGGNWDLIGFIEDLICKFKNNEISSRFPYQYLEVVEELYDKDKNQNLSNLKEILKNELKRIFMKKEGGNQRLKDYFEREILPRFEQIEDFENFANMLVIANRISREIKV
jgi:CRISPR-associated protein Cmr2